MEAFVTERREWPNNMKEIRDQAAENSMEAIRALWPVVVEGRPMDELERTRREARVLARLQSIQSLMQQAGAPIR